MQERFWMDEHMRRACCRIEGEVGGILGIVMRMESWRTALRLRRGGVKEKCFSNLDPSLEDMYVGCGLSARVEEQQVSPAEDVQICSSVPMPYSLIQVVHSAIPPLSASTCSLQRTAVVPYVVTKRSFNQLCQVVVAVPISPYHSKHPGE